MSPQGFLKYYMIAYSTINIQMGNIDTMSFANLLPVSWVLNCFGNGSTTLMPGIIFVFIQRTSLTFQTEQKVGSSQSIQLSIAYHQLSLKSEWECKK